MADEVLGRNNFVATLAWHKRISPANDAKFFSSDFDHILVFAKNKDIGRPNRLETNESQLANYRNPDNDPRGAWNSAAYTCAKTADERPNLYYAITNPFTKQEVWPSRTRVWAYPRLLSDAEIGYAVRIQSRANAPPVFTGILHTPRGESQPARTASGSLARGATVDAARQLSCVPEIRYALRSESWTPGELHPNLSWTHYRTLLRVDKTEARSFYEIEALNNNWSARELERQICSLLYERLALSRDKKGLMRLATKGHEVQRPADVFKDPVVMEFLGLPESPKLVETDLKSALIDNLQSFLLELGKGFAFVARQERLTLDGDHFYVVRGRIDFDDISYDEHADLLYELAEQMVAHLHSYLSEEDKPWRYLLIPHDEITANMTLAGLASRFAVSG